MFNKRFMQTPLDPSHNLPLHGIRRFGGHPVLPKRKSSNKDVGLSIAMNGVDRATINKAAEIVHLKPSVWARSVLLTAAQSLIIQTERKR